MEDCIFCKIVKKEISSEIVLENDEFLVFKDIHPKDDVHVLVIPKRHIASVDHAENGDTETLGKIFLTAKEVAEALGVSGAYRLQVNVGKDGGQEVDHIHMHLLAKKRKEVSEV